MENNENFVEQTENVEQTTEQTPKTYTQEEVNEIVGKRLARQEARIRKDNDRKYGRLEEVLKAGTGKEDVGEITDTFEQFYVNKGIDIPKRAAYSDKDIEVLARAEADEIIRSGFEEVVEETDRLAELGVANMTAREKAVFKALAEHRQNAEMGRELSSIGVTEDVSNSQEFKDFRAMFAPNTPVKDVYDIYQKTKPQKEFKSMGSMKNNTSAESAVKEYYSPEEARKFTAKELRDNPAIEEAILRSMQKWKK